MTDQLIIFDTTLRDGEQSPGAAMTKDEKIRIARQLERLGVDVIEAGFAAASLGDAEAIKSIAGIIKNSTVCSLARANERDVRAAGEAITPAASGRIHTFIATSPIHMEKKLRMQPDQVVEAAVKAVKMALEYTDNVEFSAEDAVRSEMDFLCRVFEAVIKAGAKTLNVPDTVGYSIPALWGERMRQLIERVPNSDKVVWSTHCHNDLGMAVANSLAAVMNGARQVECTINGLGERAGNASLEEIVMAVKTRRDVFGCDSRIDTTQIVPTSRLVSQVTGYPVQPNKAIVGANAFSHESGIHQDGVLKHRETYEIMRAEDVGWTHNKLTLGKLSGRNAFRNRLQELGIAPESEEALNAAFSPDSRPWPTRSAKSSMRTCRPWWLWMPTWMPATASSWFPSRCVPRPARPPRLRGAVRRRQRDQGGRNRRRSRGCLVQGHREAGGERFDAAALFGEQHHHRDGCPGRGDGTSEPEWPHRQRPGRRHRHRHRLGQGLPQRAEQAVRRRGTSSPSGLTEIGGKQNGRPKPPVFIAWTGLLL
jgi:2-isopropylmalate synthase